MSAPLWDSKTSTFAGLLTSTDFINVIQFYLQFPERFEEVDQLRLSSLRGVWTDTGAHSLLENIILTELFCFQRSRRPLVSHP